MDPKFEKILSNIRVVVALRVDIATIYETVEGSTMYIRNGHRWHSARCWSLRAFSIPRG